jgi:hypothetical protein
MLNPSLIDLRVKPSVIIFHLERAPHQHGSSNVEEEEGESCLVTREYADAVFSSSELAFRKRKSS